MNDSTNSSKGLLVLRLKDQVTSAVIDELMEVITPTAEALGVEPMVLPPGVDVKLQMGTSPILSRIADALEALVRQGEPPIVNEAEIAPQTLNGRAAHPAYRSGQTGGLNTRG